MSLPDADACYRALAARDARFDGVFFVGVATTGIYCRPVCRARLPRRDRCTFHRTAAEAERAGFRACFRCRPELAPGRAPIDALPRLVAAAASRIEAGALDDGSVADLARELGVTPRHLGRTVEAALGVTPIELAQSRRLALAKRLLQDTDLPITEVALSSGFRSLRRFHALIRSKLGVAPTHLRAITPAGPRARPGSTPDDAAAAALDAPITLRLDYRGPYALDHLFGFFATRAVPGVESAGPGWYARTVRLGDHAGTVAFTRDPSRPALRAHLTLSLAPVLGTLVPRLRALFDLDADPHAIDSCLSRDRLLRARVRALPGLRVPGVIDPFELAVRAVLGQQVSVAAARTLAGRLAGGSTSAPLSRFFPTAAELAARSEPQLAAIGLPRTRARTLRDLSRACAGGALTLAPGTPLDELTRSLEALPGIGPWTAHYIAMRALRHPDAFPASDLGVRKALDGASPARILARAEPWRPWRAYAVMHLWNGAPT